MARRKGKKRKEEEGEGRDDGDSGETPAMFRDDNDGVSMQEFMRL